MFYQTSIIDNIDENLDEDDIFNENLLEHNCFNDQDEQVTKEQFDKILENNTDFKMQLSV